MADDKRIPLGPSGDRIVRSLRRYREDRGLTYKELTERLTALGRPIGRSGLRRIEAGERRVDVDELIALARALRVHPIVLVFPLGEARTVELLPNEDQPTWDAVSWFTGHGGYPGDQGDAGNPMVDLLAIHEGLAKSYKRELTRLRVVNQMPESPHTQAQARAAEARMHRLEREIGDSRRSLRGLGFTPTTLPELPSALAWLDTLTADEWHVFITNGSTEEGGDA